MIYVYGNSHVNVFTRTNTAQQGGSSNTLFKANAKWPVSAKDFINVEWDTLMGFLTGFDKAKDYILIPVGEHDCRVNLAKGIAVDVIHTYIDHFFEVLLKLKREGYRPIGWGSHPSDNIPASKEWDTYLGSKCKENEILFISIMNYVLKENGEIDKTYYEDAIHLKNEEILPKIMDELHKINVI